MLDYLYILFLFFKVEVVVNGIPASCQNRNCAFTFPEENMPTIASVSPNEGGQDGLSITISGFDFPNDASLVTVTIGGMICTIESINDTNIICVPSQNEVGIYAIEVLIDGFGFALPENEEDVYFSYTLQVDNVSPQVGSVLGGNLVTLSGVGFPIINDDMFKKYSMNEFGLFFHPDVYILFDELPCFITASNFTHLSCMPQAHQSDTVNITLVIDSVNTLIEDAVYEYALSASSVVNTIFPDSGTVSGNNEITIIGENFSNDVVVKIGENTCEIISVKQTQIVCNASSHQPGEFEVIINSLEYGTSYNVSIIGNVISDIQIPLAYLQEAGIVQNHEGLVRHFPTYTYELFVTSISPIGGSVRGGTEVTITGKGFENAIVMETLGGRECTITSVSYEEIKCVIPSTTNSYTIKNTGVHPGKQMR